MPISPWETLSKSIPNSDLHDFGFTVPLDVVKSASGEEEEGRPIRGVASTPHTDLQKEDVVQKGLDCRYFLNYGYYNDDHKEGIEHKVGQPTIAIVKSTEDRNGGKTAGLWTEGFLWKAGLHKGADAIWDLTKAMEGSNADRRMGFSIQGKVLKRDGNKILKAWIQDIAITASPINNYTWLELVNNLEKSIWASNREVQDIQKSITDLNLFKSGNSLLDDDSLFEDLQKTKEEIEEEEYLKALAAQSNPLVGQSLESNMKVHDFSINKKKSGLNKSLKQAYEMARREGYNASWSRKIALATVTLDILS